ncbi:MAG: xanthine dehydrogenase family protein subunit M [Gammaproteobacteria bacterium]|nr:xanthine dehydrogenase family protein subunit M [Gammaproteobacteria bacterium]
MYQFNYHRPSTLDEATSLMAGAADGVYLSGGMTLIPTLKQRLASPSDVIDLGAIPGLTGVTVNDGTVSVGGMTRHAEVAASDAIPALADLASRIGDAHVRNRGTIGGSLANSDPAADYPAAVVALCGTVHTTTRSIAANDYFTGLFETALHDGEIVTSVDFCMPEAAAYEKFPNPASRYAVVGVMVARCPDCICVGVTGAGACAFRATALEEALAADFSPGAVDGVGIDHSEFNSDIHASAEFRGHLVGVLTKRAVARIA